MKRTKILIVEDEVITILDLQDRLQRLGYSVLGFATCGEDAIRQVEKECPDLVLMDIQLRGEMDGIETADAIRQLFDIPVIYLTAYSDDDTLRRARITEPFGFLLKPFAERELHTNIEMALYKHRSEQALKESEQRLRLYSRRLETLHQIDQAILAADSLEAIIQAALHLVEQLVPCQQACVVTLDCQANEAIVSATCVNGETMALRRSSSLLSESEYCQELSTGNGQTVDHDRLVRQLTANDEWWAEPTPFYVNVPLLTQGMLLGILSLGSGEPDAFSQEQLEIVHEVANSLAIAIHQAHLRERIERHAAELEARNAELKAFAHTVAHDIQDPMGIIVGFADILTQDWENISNDELQEYLQIMSRTGHKVSNIVHELMLLAEARIQDVAIYPLDMGSIVTQAQSRLHHLIKEYSAEISFPDTWPVAMGHEPWVEEVWVNYLSNALKYGGRPPRVDLGATMVGDQVRFWVRDNGPGVPPEAQEQLFVPFTRLAQVRVEGHGLGLSIVQRIVEKLGGQVGVESEGVPGEGSVFSFTLPAARG